MTEPDEDQQPASGPSKDLGKTVHGEAANAGHRVLAPDDADRRLRAILARTPSYEGVPRLVGFALVSRMSGAGV